MSNLPGQARLLDGYKPASSTVTSPPRRLRALLLDGYEPSSTVTSPPARRLRALLDGYEPSSSTVTSPPRRLRAGWSLVKLDRGRAGGIGRRLEPEGLGGSGVGASAGYAVTTHARTCSSVAPASKRRCRWPPCGPCTRMGIRALWRAPELSGVIGAPREGSGLAPRRLGRRLHLERLLGESSGLCLCLCLASQPFQLVRWSSFVPPAPNRRACRRPAGQIARDRAPRRVRSPPRQPRLSRSRARAADLKARAATEIVPRSPHPRASACTPSRSTLSTRL